MVAGISRGTWSASSMTPRLVKEIIEQSIKICLDADGQAAV